MISWYMNWRSNRRLERDARGLVREGRRTLRRYGHRLTEAGKTAVREAIEALAAMLTSGERGSAFAERVNALDKALDDYLPQARKSTIREYAESIGVAVLIALLLRAFVVEAFKIPSGSMIPTLEVGDHIFVNKFIYGVRVPFTNYKIGELYRRPQRGEVIVFIYPKNPDQDFIKRIIAVEGDTVEIKDNQVFINDKPVPREHIEGDCTYTDYHEETGKWATQGCDRWRETLDGNTYDVLYNKYGQAHSWAPVKVPPQSVFVMGDNRDNSHDSRWWGFVPYDLIRGKAMVIWWSSGEPEGFVRLRRMFHLVR
jgi:signal peptidase I